MSTKRKQRRRQQRTAPGMSHHRRRCSVCCHPEREAIEEAFLDWGNVSSITEEYRLPGRTAIYRHARALGLDRRREGHLRRVLERIIEKSSTVRPTAETIVRAVELYARLFSPPAAGFEPPEQIATHTSRT